MTGQIIHGDQRYQKPPAVKWGRPQASPLPQLLNSHGPIADRLTTITNFQYRRLNRNRSSAFCKES